MRRRATIQRLKERVDDLCNDIGGYLNYFEQSDVFTGPTVYFHCKTIEKRRSHTSLSTLLEDEVFFDYLYATLTAWGMNSRGAKLLDPDPLVQSVRKQEKRIGALWELRLIDLSQSELTSTVGCIWDILDGLQVSATDAKLVANTKTLHHVLPDLVPPMDNFHTRQFFRSYPSASDKSSFLAIYPIFWQVVDRVSPQISARVNKHAFHTSVPKVIDNAVIGFVRKEKEVKGKGDQV